MYTRANVYPNGAPIPDSLPSSYQPAAYGNAPAGQSCFTCKNFNLANRYCAAWRAPVKPRWWCEGWASIAVTMPRSPNQTILKKITTSTVEEHFSKSNSLLRATQENEEDVVKLNIPLVIRLLEFAREDATEDADLHLVVENLIELSADGSVLEMEDYEDIVDLEK